MGIFALSFAHHVNHFGTAQDRTSAVHGLEPKHRAHPSLDDTMVLLNTIVQVGTLPDANRLQRTS